MLRNCASDVLWDTVWTSQRVLRKSRFLDNCFSVKNSCAEFHENPTDGLVTDTGSQKNGRSNKASAWTFIFYFVKNLYCIVMSRVLSKACHVHAMHHDSWSDRAPSPVLCHPTADIPSVVTKYSDWPPPYKALARFTISDAVQAGAYWRPS